MFALEFVVAMIVAIMVGTVVARSLRMSAPVTLVGVGIALSLVPGFSGVGLPPGAVLFIFLPVLL